ncbi:MAG TPA: site-specific integrase, partial [Candidatus Stercorousia faecigallinarum]|nr:site-specific integrase [Candidatus Stercorousia faecigallinarum]
MTTVEPIRKISDLRKIEKILASQSMRNLVLFTIGTNCGLRIS